ncbi:histidine phosphatase family protein [Chengkuizengella sp. SCS-71B]|uniref:histidine phosphatase family protein n=1 Tax=Chengkuizengella sp. SCS-71B TaxID=3115290 RepID=UPI0032C234BB
MMNIYVVRHCKAGGQESSAPLTDLGLQEANKLSEFLLSKNIDFIISSPYERAHRTIAPLAEKLEIDIVFDNRLTERILSNKNNPEWRSMLKNTYDNLDLCYDGGESSMTAMSRAISVIDEVLSKEFKNIVLVSHGNLISLILKHYDDRFGFKEWESFTNPDVYLLSFTQTPPNISRIWRD